MIKINNNYKLKDLYEVNPEFKVLGNDFIVTREYIIENNSWRKNLTEELIDKLYNEELENQKEYLDEWEMKRIYLVDSNNQYNIYQGNSGYEACLITDKENKPIASIDVYELSNSFIFHDVLILPGRDTVECVHLPTMSTGRNNIR